MLSILFREKYHMFAFIYGGYHPCLFISSIAARHKPTQRSFPFPSLSTRKSSLSWRGGGGALEEIVGTPATGNLHDT